MKSRPLEQLALLFGFFVAFVCFVVQMLQGSSLLWSAFVACCVVLGTSIVALYVVRALGVIMARYLRAQSEETQNEETSESRQVGGGSDTGEESGR